MLNDIEKSNLTDSLYHVRRNLGKLANHISYIQNLAEQSADISNELLGLFERAQKCLEIIAEREEL